MPEIIAFELIETELHAMVEIQQALIHFFKAFINLPELLIHLGNITGQDPRKLGIGMAEIKIIPQPEN